ncbi:MAG: molecular chaperone HtpG [Deltaproteobacteria bacterium]|nr:MAG: molecular chaperone HtpG [Deltaproteobacteria bacterium]
MAAKKSTRKFRTEVAELLDLIIHSLYSNKEIFLRELISNSSDALDKLTFATQTRPELLAEGETLKDLEIELIPDPEAGTLEVRDNGIGMSFDEVVENIGTIAKSGTASFAAAIKEAKEKSALAPELIGQFGVGFYSAFMVAEKITLITRAADAPNGVKWESAGDGSYTIEEVEKSERGTRVILNLREPEEGEPDWTREWTLRDTVKRHSDFVSYPVTMMVTRSMPELDEEGKPIEGSSKEERKKDVLNSMKAIWARPKSELTEEEYNDFYKHLSHDWSDPLTHLHLKLEGATEFDALPFIPERRPMDLFMPEMRHGVQLYCKRVFIMDELKELLPSYLRFVRGVVDSADLSLNVSREILQEDRIVRAIRKALVGKLLAHISEFDDETFLKFYKEFGIVLKEGVHTDFDNRQKIAKLIRYKTTTSEEKLKSLDEYIADMAEGEDTIYYLTGDNPSTIAKSPHLEALRKRGIEVLLMTDPVDEFVVDALGEYEGKKLRSAEKGELGDDTPEEQQAAEKEATPFLEKLKDALLEKVTAVKASRRLTDSAACLVSGEDQASALMAKMMRASGHAIGDEKRTLEVNLGHPLIASVKEVYESDSGDGRMGEYAELIYDLALLGEGGRLGDPAEFARRVSNLAAKAIK